ncbi:sensor histidine kinase [Marinactinospora rubrisoli]|uniref:histidine kinase n=1 Tax=Marinactinospora rubrisoli TaxID=2715399 RepID=A0ABW2KL97_9ACTN
MSAAGRRWRSRSLARRLPLAVLCLTAVALLAFGGVATVLLHRSLMDEVDSRLHDLADAPHRGAPPPGGPGEHRPPPFPTDLRLLRVGADGRVLDVVGRTEPDDPLPDVAGLAIDDLLAREGEPFTVPGTGESRWRIIASDGGDGTVLVTAQSLAEVHGTLTQLVVIEVGVGLAVLAALGIAAVMTVRMQLRPLHEIEMTAQAIAAGDLERRIADQDPGTESGRLGAALNVMLGELLRALYERDRSAAATRRFVADASHELRTPLSSIRGFAELYRQGRAQGLVAENAHADRWFSRIESEAARMAGLVEDLLMLARFDEAPHVEYADVDLRRIAEHVTADARARFPGSAVTLRAPDRVRVLGDADRLRQVLDNLVGNALTHTPAGTPVEVTVHSAAAEQPVDAVGVGELPEGVSRVAVLTVRDEGPGIPEKELGRVFDRFYRVDESRTRGGTGLGLSVSASLVAAHHGRISADSRPGAGSTFRVVLPAE